MRKGFSHEVAPELIRRNPGMTAREAAKSALDQGLCSSDAKDPVASLANTLAKEVREGRLPEIRADRVNGILRYYPTLPAGTGTASKASDGPSAAEEAVSMRLPRKHAAVANLLVEAGRFNNRSDALVWLIAEGIVRNQPLIERVRKAVEQIRTIKQSVAQ